MSRSSRGSDALGAMYFVAALLLGIAAVGVIVLMFVPPDLLTRSRDRWVPGSVPGYVDTIPSVQTPAERQAEEELHIH